MAKSKEKFLFDDDLMEEMHRKKEIEDKILKPVTRYAIFNRNGSIIIDSIKTTKDRSWKSVFKLSWGSNSIKKLKKEGYQCRQIKIQALKK